LRRSSRGHRGARWGTNVSLSFSSSAVSMVEALEAKMGCGNGPTEEAGEVPMGVCTFSSRTLRAAKAVEAEPGCDLWARQLGM
jgi:hypothetical protein